MSFFVGFLIISLSILLFWYRWRKKQFHYFKILGIPGPKPNFLTGNLLEISKNGMPNCHIKWTKKYGNIVGYFLGSKPVLLISDPQFVKFMITNHINFVDKDWFLDDGGIPVPSFRKCGVGIVKIHRWKDIRSILSPIFTGTKLKEMSIEMRKAIDELLKNIGISAKEGKTINMLDTYSNFSFDMTMNVFFGIEIHEQKEHSAFLRDLDKCLNSSFEHILIFLNICFNEISTVFVYLRQILDTVNYYLGKDSVLGAFKFSEKIIQVRNSNPKLVRRDFLQLLLDSKKEKGTDKQTKNLISKNSLNSEEIVANAINVAVGAYDTTSTTLTYFSYVMVKYPEIQEKLRNELRELKNNGLLDDGFIHGIPYLDQLVNEILRFYPIVPNIITRIARENIQYESFAIPKNLTIQVAVRVLHQDSKIWADPEHFDSERFNSENKENIKSVAFQGFGFGPRNCIGMRFARVVLRQVIANLFLNYKFEWCKETVDIKPGSEIVVVRPEQPLFIKAVPLFISI